MHRPSGVRPRYGQKAPCDLEPTVHSRICLTGWCLLEQYYIGYLVHYTRRIERLRHYFLGSDSLVTSVTVSALLHHARGSTDVRASLVFLEVTDETATRLRMVIRTFSSLGCPPYSLVIVDDSDSWRAEGERERLKMN